MSFKEELYLFIKGIIFILEKVYRLLYLIPTILFIPVLEKFTNTWKLNLSDIKRLIIGVIFIIIILFLKKIFSLLNVEDKDKKSINYQDEKYE